MFEKKREKLSYGKLFLTKRRTISTSKAIETKTVKMSQSEPQNVPQEAAITSEDIFAEAARVGEAKKGIAIEDIFAQSAQIGFQNRK